MESTRTISEILSLTTGELLMAEDIFRDQRHREAEIFQLRTRIEDQIQTGAIEYVCLYCKQPVAIRGRPISEDGFKHFYFTHPYKSKECIIKTTHKLTEEQVRCLKYNGEKESELHNRTKHQIGQYLEQTEGVSEISIDRVYRDTAVSMEWKRPDVLATYHDVKIAFELQLSTTFLSVIVSRTRFYRQRSIFLIWFFADFSIVNDLQKFTQKDVYYNNNFNVYVFDGEAELRSKSEGQLVFKCYYKSFAEYEGRLWDRWEERYITMSDIQFVGENAYYFDSASLKAQLERELRERLETQQRSLRREAIDRNVERVASYFKEFYAKDKKPQAVYCPLGAMRDVDEIEALRDKFQFDDKYAHVISRMFFETHKPNFLEFLSGYDNLSIDPTNYRSDAKGVFIHVFENSLIGQPLSRFLCLFKLGYTLSEEDKLFLSGIHNMHLGKSDEASRWRMELWVLAIHFNQLSNRKHINDFGKVQKVFFAIASLKYGTPIHYNFRSLIQVTHNLIAGRPQYMELFIHAMKVYKEFEKQLAEDKSGKLKSKVEQFYWRKPKQDWTYRLILFALFPEISDGLRDSHLPF